MLSKQEICGNFFSDLDQIRGSYRCILVMRDKLFSFSMKSEFRKLFFVIRVLEVLHDPWRTWIIHLYPWYHLSILRESSIWSGLDVWFAIRSLDLAFHDFSFFKQCYIVRTGYWKKVSYFFSWFGKTKILYMPDPWSSSFYVREPCDRPPTPPHLYDPTTTYHVAKIIDVRTVK